MTGEARRRWSAHPWRARCLRLLVYALPVAGSLAFVHFATVVTGVPTGSLAAFLLWWFSLSLGATAAVSLVYALTRRLLPLGALLELSLVFPDEAPSRFRLALQSGTVESLEERLRSLQAAGEAPSAQEAAEILLRLVAALDVHDRITRGHAERVRAYAAGIGRQLGLPGDALDCLNWAALLHDIGKLEVSAEILNKQGRPTDEEWELLRVHPLHGETLVAPLEEWLGEWSAAVGYHHERWDGTGYPRGAGGEAIPLAGRIVAIADVYDVITSARSYKQPASAAEARSELVRCSGTQFDPRLVRAFVSISLSRMRFVLGPLSWLTHTPMLARFPLTQSSATAFGGLAALSAAAMLGVTTPNGTALAASPSAARPTPLAGSRGANGAQPARIGTQASPRQIPRGGKPARGQRASARPSAQAPTSEPGPAVSPTPARAFPEAPPPPPLASPAPPASLPRPTPTPATAPKHTPPPAPPAPTPPDPSLPSAPPANVAPSFTAGPNQTVLEDGAAQSVGGWATAIAPGPAGEAGQTVSFTASSDNPGLFAVQPSVAPSGTLAYTPAANASGAATVTVTATDNGGTTNGGADTSAPASFTITINPVNDAPRFTAGPNQTAISLLGARSVPGWATAIAPGPAGETGQTVSFTASSDNPGLFAVQPAVAPDGTLTYTPTLLAVGIATVTISVTDNGGTANGGVDTSGSVTFTITIV